MDSVTLFSGWLLSLVCIQFVYIAFYYMQGFSHYDLLYKQVMMLPYML